MQSDGKITLPCDAAVLEYVLNLLRRNASADIENALLSSMVTPCHYTSTLDVQCLLLELANILFVASEEHAYMDPDAVFCFV